MAIIGYYVTYVQSLYDCPSVRSSAFMYAYVRVRVCACVESDNSE